MTSYSDTINDQLNNMEMGSLYEEMIENHFNENIIAFYCTNKKNNTRMDLCIYDYPDLSRQVDTYNRASRVGMEFITDISNNQKLVTDEDDREWFVCVLQLLNNGIVDEEVQDKCLVAKHLFGLDVVGIMLCFNEESVRDMFCSAINTKTPLPPIVVTSKDTTICIMCGETFDSRFYHDSALPEGTYKISCCSNCDEQLQQKGEKMRQQEAAAAAAAELEKEAAKEDKKKQKQKIQAAKSPSPNKKSKDSRDTPMKVNGLCICGKTGCVRPDYISYTSAAGVKNNNKAKLQDWGKAHRLAAMEATVAVEKEQEEKEAAEFVIQNEPEQGSKKRKGK